MICINVAVDSPTLYQYVLLHSKYNLTQEKDNSSDDFYVADQQQLTSIPINVKNLHFCHFNQPLDMFTIDNNTFCSLRSIHIGVNSLFNDWKFVIEGLPSLIEISIGNNCHTRNHETMRNDGLFRVMDCPMLCRLKIANDCFNYFKEFGLSNLPSLQLLDIGNNCFLHSDFIVKGM